MGKMMYRVLFILFLAKTSMALGQPCDTLKPGRQKTNFKLKNKFKAEGSEQIEVGIYMRRIDSSKYEYYRFFQNGRVFSSYVYCHRPDSIELVDTRFGWKGYYVIEHDKIRMEFYSDGYSGFVISDFLISERKITEVSYKSRGFWTTRFQLPVPKPFEYVPIKISSNPDW